MSRRIVYPGGPIPMAGPAEGADSYPDKVAKLIPGESTACYVAVNAILAGGADPTADWIRLGAFVIILALTPFYILRIGTNSELKPTRKQLVLTSAAFVLWAMAVNDPLRPFMHLDPRILAVSLPLFTFGVGKL